MYIRPHHHKKVLIQEDEDFLWLWATKKIFTAVLGMNSNSYIKKMKSMQARMKSAKADEIFGYASDEIKSTYPPSRRISSNEVGFHRRRRFHPPARVDLVEKSIDKVDAFFWRSRRDLNPRYPFGVHTISSRARYDHFDTAPWLLLRDSLDILQHFPLFVNPPNSIFSRLFYVTYRPQN